MFGRHMHFSSNYAVERILSGGTLFVCVPSGGHCEKTAVRRRRALIVADTKTAADRLQAEWCAGLKD